MNKTYTTLCSLLAGTILYGVACTTPNKTNSNNYQPYQPKPTYATTSRPTSEKALGPPSNGHEENNKTPETTGGNGDDLDKIVEELISIQCNKSDPRGTVDILVPKLENVRKYDLNNLSIDKKEALSSVFNNCGYCQIDLKDYESAISSLSVSIRLAPNYSNYYNRAMVYYKIGRLDECLNDLYKARELNPGDTKIEKSISNVESKKLQISQR